jgi:hypothetical protein
MEQKFKSHGAVKLGGGERWEIRVDVSAWASKWSDVRYYYVASFNQVLVYFADAQADVSWLFILHISLSVKREHALKAVFFA